MKKGRHWKVCLVVALLQVSSEFLVLMFIRGPVETRIEDSRSIGAELALWDYQKELVSRGIVTKEEIPEDLRQFPDKNLMVGSSLGYGYDYLAMIIPALVLQLVAFGLSLSLAFRKNEIPGPSPNTCLLYTSPSPRDQRGSRMPSSA